MLGASYSSVNSFFCHLIVVSVGILRCQNCSVIAIMDTNAYKCNLKFLCKFCWCALCNYILVLPYYLQLHKL